MNLDSPDFLCRAENYLNQLNNCFTSEIYQSIACLADDLRTAWIQRRQIFICGNGGSAANAIHMANDFHYGIGACGEGEKLPGMRVEALPANTSILTCLANDTGYENIFANQIEVKANPGDIAIVLSGSGNSPNIVNALKRSKQLGLKSYAILAFNGGIAKEIADLAIHFPIDDMQIAEDTQLIVGHLCMQWLNSNKPSQLQSLLNG